LEVKHKWTDGYLHKLLGHRTSAMRMWHIVPKGVETTISRFFEWYLTRIFGLKVLICSHEKKTLPLETSPPLRAEAFARTK
jgi:hypothetical protein